MAFQEVVITERYDQVRDVLGDGYCLRVFDRPDTVVSDHYGLVADLTLPPGDPG